jgi:hypothetical protein
MARPAKKLVNVAPASVSSLPATISNTTQRWKQSAPKALKQSRAGLALSSSICFSFVTGALRMVDEV